MNNRESTETLCDVCGKSIEGAYVSFGGNIVPYVPAKCYHMGCVPKLCIGVMLAVHL